VSGWIKITLILGAKCVDGVVMVSDTKITGSEKTYFRNDTKMFGELTNIVFGFAGFDDMVKLFRRYVVGDVIILRDSPTERYTDANLIDKLADIMRAILKFRSGFDFKLKVMIARLVSGTPDLHVIDSHGNIDRDFTKNWITIGSGSQKANSLLEQEYKETGNMKEFAALSYLIIRSMEEQDPNGEVGVGTDRPNVTYLRRGANSDALPSEIDWKDFESSLPEYFSHFKK
jgi:20S proteasome alpha/beta subunit